MSAGSNIKRTALSSSCRPPSSRRVVRTRQPTSSSRSRRSSTQASTILWVTSPSRQPVRKFVARHVLDFMGCNQCEIVTPNRRILECWKTGLRHIERQSCTQTSRPAAPRGKPSWSSVHPKSNDRDSALKRLIGGSPRRDESRSEPPRRIRAVSPGHALFLHPV
jgi:hypothetical protein